MLGLRIWQHLCDTVPGRKTLAWWTWRRWLSNEVEEEILRQMIEFSSSACTDSRLSRQVSGERFPPQTCPCWEGSLDFSPFMSSGFSPGALGCTCNRPHYRVHTGLTTWPPPGRQGTEAASWRTARATQGWLLSLRVPSGRRLAPLCIHPAPAGLLNQLWGCLQIKGAACCGLGSGGSVCVCVCFPQFPVPCQGSDKHTTRQLSLAEITA